MAPATLSPSGILTLDGISVVHSSFGPPGFFREATSPSKSERTFRPRRREIPQSAGNRFFGLGLIYEVFGGQPWASDWQVRHHA